MESPRGHSLGRLCVQMYCTLTVTVLTVQSVQRPFHELEFLVGGWWVCKPILVIGFARARPQADQLEIGHFLLCWAIQMKPRYIEH